MEVGVRTVLMLQKLKTTQASEFRAGSKSILSCNQLFRVYSELIPSRLQDVTSYSDCISSCNQLFRVYSKLLLAIPSQFRANSELIPTYYEQILSDNRTAISTNHIPVSEFTYFLLGLEIYLLMIRFGDLLI